MVNFLAAAAHHHRQSRIHFDKSFNYILHHSTISAVCAMMCSIIFLNNFLNLVREMCLFLLVVAHGNIEIDKANENEKSICFGSHDVDPSGLMQHSSYGLTSKTSQYFLLLKAYTSSLNIAVCYLHFQNGYFVMSIKVIN